MTESANDLAFAVWRKASASANPGGACVEVAAIQDGFAVRDSKDPSGPALIFRTSEWDAHIVSSKDGLFDLA
ncbi:DUF397 domain-containing protein [Flindersiella endophytica]